MSCLSWVSLNTLDTVRTLQPLGNASCWFWNTRDSNQHDSGRKPSRNVLITVTSVPKQYWRTPVVNYVRNWVQLTYWDLGEQHRRPRSRISQSTRAPGLGKLLQNRSISSEIWHTLVQNDIGEFLAHPEPHTGPQWTNKGTSIHKHGRMRYYPGLMGSSVRSPFTGMLDLRHITEYEATVV